MKPSDPALDRLAVAKNLLLDPYGLDEAKLQRALASIFEHRADYADLYFQYTRSESYSLEEGIVKSGSFDIEQGVGVRAVVGDKTAFAYSDDISVDALNEAAVSARSIARHGAGKAKVAPKVALRAQPVLYGSHDPVASLDAAEKIRMLEKIEQFARAARQAREAGDGQPRRRVRRRAGRAQRRRARRRRAPAGAAVGQRDRRGRRAGASRDSAGGGGRYDLAYFDDALLADYANKAVDQALVNLVAKPAPAGVMPVVLGPGWPGILLHEAIGHGLEGDFNRKGSSAFAGKVGERVASKGVTVVDDGTLANRRGSLNIDDEGNPTQNTVLIEDGVLRGYIQDSLNARLMKVPVTGNARRESFAHLPMPRMTNTYMLAGDKDPDEIVRSVKKGIYATNFGGGQVDITNGKFVFSMAEAYMIENGRITYPVKGATLIGNGPDALTRVTMIGNDMGLDPGIGTCGKDGQSVPVGVGQPTLRIEGLTIGGTA